MANVSQNLIKIYGGFDEVQYFSDGVLVNTDEQSVVRTLSAEGFKFRSLDDNDCFVTEQQSVVALVQNTAEGNLKLVGISSTDYAVKEIHEFN